LTHKGNFSIVLPRKSEFLSISIQSVALIFGEVFLKQFSYEKVKDSAVQELMKRVKYVHPPEMGSGLVELKG
jgi:hypothetical protein